MHRNSNSGNPKLLDGIEIMFGDLDILFSLAKLEDFLQHWDCQIYWTGFHTEAEIHPPPSRNPEIRIHQHFWDMETAKYTDNSSNYTVFQWCNAIITSACHNPQGEGKGLSSSNQNTKLFLVELYLQLNNMKHTRSLCVIPSQFGWTTCSCGHYDH